MITMAVFSWTRLISERNAIIIARSKRHFDFFPFQLHFLRALQKCLSEIWWGCEKCHTYVTCNISYWSIVICGYLSSFSKFYGIDPFPRYSDICTTNFAQSPMLCSCTVLFRNNWYHRKLCFRVQFLILGWPPGLERIDLILNRVCLSAWLYKSLLTSVTFYNGHVIICNMLFHYMEEFWRKYIFHVGKMPSCLDLWAMWWSRG